MDLDGSADGIHGTFNLSSNQAFSLKIHSCARFKFSGKSKINITTLLAKDESILASFDDLINDFKSLAFINPVHIESESLKRYSEDFMNNSVISLDNFMTESTFKSLIGSLNNFQNWPRSGPADYRSFKYMLRDFEGYKLHSILMERTFISWLSKITGLPLIQSARPVYSRCIQSAGDYQILHGNYSEPLGIDLIFNFYPSLDYVEWLDNYCGRIHYLNESGDEILQVNSKNNSLTIVYRTEGCTRFTENVKGIPDIPLFQTMAIYTAADETFDQDQDHDQI